MALALRSLSLIFTTILTLSISLIWLEAPYAQEAEAPTSFAIEQFGNPPEIPSGPLSDDLEKAVNTAFVESVEKSEWGPAQTQALDKIAASKDPRLAWILSDMMRFIPQRELHQVLADAAAKLLGRKFEGSNNWGDVTDHLLAWNVPAPPDYLAIKRAIYTSIIPGWERIFVEGNVDWRLVSWGGVLIDNRPHDKTDEVCNCIPAADNPEVTSAEKAKWLKEDDIVFGIEVNGEYRAYPRRIMEVREMVNDTLGGRDLGIPYCTLCGSAQAFFTDQLPKGVKRPILRTSGLLSRSNKLMYDLTSYSVMDTFTGEALTGPLAEKNIKLKQASVITSDWGSWKKAHPTTTVLKEKYALGRDPDFRNTRDADGPIFPVGDVDPRLPVHEDVIGAITDTGKPIAFQRSHALVALKKGDEITFENVKLELDAGGIKAVDKDGSDIGSHQAFWFAWSQFHPDTALWSQ